MQVSRSAETPTVSGRRSRSAGEARDTRPVPRGPPFEDLTLGLMQALCCLSHQAPASAGATPHQTRTQPAPRAACGSLAGARLEATGRLAAATYPPRIRVPGHKRPQGVAEPIEAVQTGRSSPRPLWGTLRRQRGDPCTKSTRSSTGSGTRRPASSSTARPPTRRSRSTTSSG